MSDNKTFTGQLDLFGNIPKQENTSGFNETFWTGNLKEIGEKYGMNESLAVRLSTKTMDVVKKLELNPDDYAHPNGMWDDVLSYFFRYDRGTFKLLNHKAAKVFTMYEGRYSAANTFIKDVYNSYCAGKLKDAELIYKEPDWNRMNDELDDNFEKAKKLLLEYFDNKMEAGKFQITDILDDGSESGFFMFEFKAETGKYCFKSDSRSDGNQKNIIVTKTGYSDSFNNHKNEMKKELCKNEESLLTCEDYVKTLLLKREKDSKLYHEFLGNEEEPEQVKKFRAWCDNILDNYKGSATKIISTETVQDWKRLARDVSLEKLQETLKLLNDKPDYTHEFDYFVDSTIISEIVKSKDDSYISFGQPYTELRRIAQHKFDKLDSIRKTVIEEELNCRNRSVLDEAKDKSGHSRKGHYDMGR